MPRVYIFLGVIVGAVAVSTTLYYFVSQKQVSSPVPIVSNGNPIVGTIASDTDSFDVSVLFDGELFTPKDVSVRKGTRVRFLNTSDTEVWPASAVHPTHSIYPEKHESDCLGSSFDACRPLLKDEYFDFTFDAVGEWRYHDHVKAYKTGVVTVTE